MTKRISSDIICDAGAFFLMSVRLIAQELYRIIREVEKLEKELLAAPDQNHEILKDRLRKAKAERDLMRRSLEGSKDVANALSSRFLLRNGSGELL
jgi:hypothetical protein